MKYNISYIDNPSSDCQIEADDINLNSEAKTVSFYKDPVGNSFVKTIAVLTLVSGMRVISDDKKTAIVPAEELRAA